MITCKTGSRFYQPEQEIRTDLGSIEKGSFSQRCEQVWKDIAREEEELAQLRAKKLVNRCVKLFSWMKDFAELAYGIASANQLFKTNELVATANEASWIAASVQEINNAVALEDMSSKARLQVKDSHKTAVLLATSVASFHMESKHCLDATKIGAEMLQAAGGFLDGLKHRKWANYIFTAKQLTDQADLFAELFPEDQTLATLARTARNLIDEKLNKRAGAARALNINLKSGSYILTDAEIYAIQNGVFNSNAQISAARDLAYKKSPKYNLTIEEIRAQLVREPVVNPGVFN